MLFGAGAPSRSSAFFGGVTELCRVFWRSSLAVFGGVAGPCRVLWRSLALFGALWPFFSGVARRKAVPRSLAFFRALWPRLGCASAAPSRCLTRLCRALASRLLPRLGAVLHALAAAPWPQRPGAVLRALVVPWCCLTRLGRALASLSPFAAPRRYHTRLGRATIGKDLKPGNFNCYRVSPIGKEIKPGKSSVHSKE